MFNVGDKVVPLGESDVYMVVSVPVGLPGNVIGRYSILSGTVRDVPGELLRKAQPIEEVRWNLGNLGYKITGSGEDWFAIENRLVVEFDEADKVVPFAVADVNGYELAYDHTVQGIIRSTIYCLEMK